MSQRAAPLVGEVSGFLRNGRLPQQHPGVNSSNSFNSYAKESSPIERPSKPEPLDSAAYHGIAGEIVRAIGPHSESDEAALLVQLLVMLGIFLSRNAYYLVEGSRHYCNLFSVIVGCTGKGRKGTGLSRIIQVLTLASNEFVGSNMKSGLSTGEGLIHHVRDPIEEVQPVREKGRMVDYQRVIVDAGVEDKRLFIQEPEFVRTLKAAERESNTLSAVIRQAWDSGSLSVLTKQNGEKATGAHVGIAAHITRDELLRQLSVTEAANGYCNRFLWVHSERSKLLPFGGNLSDDDLKPFGLRIREIASYARTIGRINFDSEAARDWELVYERLSDGRSGLVGAVTGRAEAQTIRLALLFALLDRDTHIRPVHLQAALAVWEYCEQSAEYIFGNALGDRTADTILSLLRERGKAGATRTEINALFSHNKPAAEIARALGVLQSLDKATAVKETKEAGGPVERWVVSSYRGEMNEKNEMNGLPEGDSSFNSFISSQQEG